MLEKENTNNKLKMWNYAKQSLRSIQIRSASTQLISLGLVLSTAFIIWQLLVLVTGTEAPVVVVLTGSMEPGIRRGDVLFLHNKNRPINSGEIIVFKIEVHRQHDSNEVNLMTKGDNNALDDSYGIYADDQVWLENHHVTGRVVGYLPYIGWATILMTDQPMFKYILISGLSLLFIASN
ncbi:uncharacterized protein LOC104905136 isoform X2 [Beta vulgaris subsp. vulgaris]|uniref:uncharacterized protein LOC104905136 isoform X2 n=1 Tax=Beta vulgaris subsp. vulgaris TaxID=3555 RepID=UPI00203757F5|nr:uncharacterized protein LOC104905136 isoform X2 [Beta vulgaris subsp. vulgaris]